MEEKFALSVGSFLSGATFYGPFDTRDDAAEYVEKWFPGEQWEIFSIFVPKCQENCL